MVALQQTFYIIAIVYMLVQICVFVCIIFMLLALYRKVARLTDIVEDKVGKVSHILSHPADAAAAASMSFFQSLRNAFAHRSSH